MNKPTNYLIPTVIEKSADGERAFDIYSRLLNERIIFLGEEVNEHTANSVVAQLLHLAYVDPEADISLYINSPGGSVYDGMAIYDTMNFIKPDVATYGIGLQASMGDDSPAVFWHARQGDRHGNRPEGNAGSEGNAGENHGQKHWPEA